MMMVLHEKSFNLPKLLENRLDVECSACKHGLFMKHEEYNTYKRDIFMALRVKWRTGNFMTGKSGSGNVRWVQRQYAH